MEYKFYKNNSFRQKIPKGVTKINHNLCSQIKAQIIWFHHGVKCDLVLDKQDYRPWIVSLTTNRGQEVVLISQIQLISVKIHYYLKIICKALRVVLQEVSEGKIHTERPHLPELCLINLGQLVDVTPLTQTLLALRICSIFKNIGRMAHRHNNPSLEILNWEVINKNFRKGRKSQG